MELEYEYEYEYEVEDNGIKTRQRLAISDPSSLQLDMVLNKILELLEESR